MGNSEAEWAVVERRGNVTVKQSGQGPQIEVHEHMFLTQAEAGEFIRLALLRTGPLRHACRVLNVEQHRSKGMCSQAYTVLITIERIFSRLDRLRGSEEREVLKVLHDASIGFEELLKLYPQNFLISDGMIGFNQRGQVLVNLNTDFSRSEAEFVLKSNRQEAEHNMLDSLLQLGQALLPGKVYSLQFCRARGQLTFPHTFQSWRQVLSNFLAGRFY